MEKKFRFGIMGAGNIARQFCDAVTRQGEGVVAAVASKSLERAEKFAKEQGISHFYGNYEEMLEREKPDAVYVAVTTNAHQELTMLCLERGIPVLCEKAMCRNGKEAEDIFRCSRENNVFVMEGMWSRFLPKMKKVKEWLEEERIGKVNLVTCNIGFQAPEDMENRYYNPSLGGGATYDILVYCYEIARYFFEDKPLECVCMTDWAKSGVDQTDTVLLKYPECIVSLTATFQGDIPNDMIFYGAKGKIVVPYPHYGKEAYLYVEGETEEIFDNDKEENGFVYEISEVIRCVREGKIESSVASHQMTLDMAQVFDQIYSRMFCASRTLDG